MLPREIDKALTLSLLTQQHAQPLFELTDRNREFLDHAVYGLLKEDTNV